MAFVKKRAPLAPNGASRALIAPPVKLPEKTMRSSIAMLK
jgi:hypothetical protein